MPTTKHRIAVSLTDSEYIELAAMADRYDVSLAWLGRQGILEFIARYRVEQLQLPLHHEARSRRVGEEDHATQ
jgi:hypothetical protein